jgi:hypothetical protein
MKTAVACCLLAAALTTFASAQGEILRVDFGTETSPVRPGFTRVTHKTVFGEGTPVGWVNPVGLVSGDMPLSRDWTVNASSGRKVPPPIYTTDLRQDHVGGQGPALLRLRVQDGPYRLWLLCGTAGGNRAQVWDLRVASGNESDEATYYGPYAARALELRGEAKGGLLDLVFSTKSRWTVCALLAVPEAEWARVQAGEIAKIEQEVFVLPDDVLKTWKHAPHEDATLLPAFTEAEKQRGFAIYSRHYLSPIWPNTVPKRDECDPTLRAFAAQDEYEPLTFALFPLRDCQRISVEVGDLRTADGKAIPREDIDVRCVRYMHVRPNYSSSGVYYRAPDVLMPFRKPQPLAKGESFRVWITVYAGPSAPEGIYKGQAKVAVEGQPPVPVPIVFRVLPITLQKDHSIVYGIYCYHPYDSMMRAPDAFSRQWWRRKAEREAADMVAHGNNAIVAGISGRMDANGRWLIDFEPLAKKIDLCRRHGLDKPIICHIPTEVAYSKYIKGGMGSHLRLLKMPPKEFFDDMTELVRAIEAGRKSRQWPELLYYPVDEPLTAELSVRFMTYLDGGYMDFFNRTDDDASPIPVALWEAYREGIDDGRYITTLGRWIERAREAGLADLAKAADADLRFVWDSIEVQEKHKHDGLWDAEAFDAFRWFLARQIIRLQEAVTRREIKIP